MSVISLSKWTGYRTRAQASVVLRRQVPIRFGEPDDGENYAEPDDDDLLFQIGSDYAMGWMWGDLGALFVYLNPLYMKVRWFKRAHAKIDGH